jgi:5-methylthioadenosine/S-adenosylhomocysteine deaminase
VPGCELSFRALVAAPGQHSYGSRIGALAVGKAADLVLIDWDKLAYPYLDPETAVLDAVIQRAQSEAVYLVTVAGDFPKF